MKTINESDVVDYQVGILTVEASKLGLKPGEIPDEIPTTLGNGLPFVLVHHTTEALYRQEQAKLQLIVVNA